MMLPYTDLSLQWCYCTLIYHHNDATVHWSSITMMLLYTDLSLQWCYRTLIYHYNDATQVPELLWQRPSPSQVVTTSCRRATFRSPRSDRLTTASTDVSPLIQSAVSTRGRQTLSISKSSVSSRCHSNQASFVAVLCTCTWCVVWWLCRLVIINAGPVSILSQCLSQELKKVRHMSHQAEKGETCLTTLRHVSRSWNIMSHQAEKVRYMSHQAKKGDQALATWKEH